MVKLRTIVIALGISLIAVPATVTSSPAADLGTIGTTYPIKEKDALVEIREKAGMLKQSRIKADLQKAVRDYRPRDSQGATALKTARQERVFTVDLTHTLEFDIPDGKGGILYPKGYRFNPLDYVNYPRTFVVINGAETRQVEWFRSSPYLKDLNVTLLINGGSYRDLIRMLKRPVFYATAPIIEKFRLQAVPSVIVQKGRLMEVREIAVEQRRGNSARK